MDKGKVHVRLTGALAEKIIGEAEKNRRSISREAQFALEQLYGLDASGKVQGQKKSKRP